jgi:undecaprenyl diphosphate synthase
MIDHLIDRGVECVSGWAISDRTGMRSQDDLKPVIKAVRAFLRVVSTTYPQRGIRFRAIGARDRLESADDLICQEIEAAERATQDGRATVILLIDYGGREELVRAYRRLCASGDPIADLKPERLAGHLDTAGIPDADLIVRPGGCPRLSGLYPFQAADAEVYVLDDVMMPDLTTDIVDEILDRYAAKRERRQRRLAVEA